MTGPPPGADRPSTTSLHRRRGGDDVVAVDRDVVDAVARGPALERRGVLVGRRRRTRRSRCSRRRRRPAAATPRRGSPPRGTRPGRPRRRRRTRPRRVPSARSWAAVAAPTAIGRPAATMPFAPKMPRFGIGDVHRAAAAAVRARASWAISSANIPSGSRPLARQWPWPRWVDVMTSAGAERPAGADGRRLLADRQVDEARAPRRRGTARRPAARSRGSRASAGASRAGRRRRP